jgi:hypothetical protein
MQPEPPGSEGSVAPTSPGGSGWRRGLTVTALFLGLAGLAASAVGMSTQLLPRKFSAAQQQQIMAWEIASRWRIRPAGQIFPATITYSLPGPDQVPGSGLGSGGQLLLTAYLVGIAAQATCRAATDPAAAGVLTAGGCVAVLRATYADQTDSMLLTVGVAVMRGAAAARSAASRLSAGQQLRPGVRALPFRDTLASGFGDSQRQLSWATSAGPYLIMSTVGYADGRPREQVATDPYASQEMTSLASGVADAVGGPLGARPRLPQCPGSVGC